MTWFDAARAGDLSELQRHLDAGQAVDEKGHSSRTALQFACDAGHLDAVRLLLDAGADPNTGRKKADKSLMLACEKHHWPLAILLLERGAKPAPREAVYEVINHGKADVLRAMVAAGLDPHGRGAVGDTVLHDAVTRAAEKDDPACLDVLLEAGAEVATAEAGRESIVWPAIVEGKHDLLRRLVSLGANINQPIAEDGKTNLMWLADIARADPIDEEAETLFRLLVELGADINRRDEDGQTALDYATEFDNHGAADLLRELGGLPGDPVDDEESDLDALESQPFAERRGTVKIWDYNSWTAAAVDLGDKPPAGAERVEVADLLAGKVDYPPAKFVLLVKLKGHRWTLAAPSWEEGIGGYDFGRWLSKYTGRPAILVGHQDTASASFLSVHESGEEKVYFESTGEEYHAEDEEDLEDVEFPTSLRSDRHPPDWWKGHADENAAMQTLLRELDAYVPMLYAAEENGQLKPQAYPADTLMPENVEWVAMLHAEAKKPKKRVPAAAAKALDTAIGRCDAAAVSEALAQGADPNRLPGGRSVPLAELVERAFIVGDAEAAAEVARLLLDAGADPDGNDEVVPLAVAAGESQYNPAAVVPIAQLLVAAGADLNKPAKRKYIGGSATPLHEAAGIGQNDVMLRFLLAHGANPHARDGDGRTPRELLVKYRDDLVEMFDGKRPEVSDRQAGMIRLLEAAERGEPPEDWRQATEAAAAEAEKRNRQIKAAVDKFQDAIASVAAVAADDAVRLEPANRTRWANAAGRDALAEPLRKAGFKTRIGVFRVSLAAGDLLLLALLDRRRNAYAVVYEQGGRHWADLVRFHVDGSMLTVTNAPTIPAAEMELPKFRKVRLKEADAAALVVALDAQAPPAEVVKLTPQEFVRRFEAAYQDEMAARRE